MFCSSKNGIQNPCAPRPRYEDTDSDEEPVDLDRPVNWDQFFAKAAKTSPQRVLSRMSTWSAGEICPPPTVALPRCCTVDMRKMIRKHSQLSSGPRERHPTYEEQIAKEAKQGNTGTKTPIGRWLAARNLERYEEGLARMGVKKVADLVFLTDEDMERLRVDPDSRMHFYVRVVA